MSILENSIDYLKGVGPNRADLLRKELKIFTYYDLLTHYPFRYIDKSRIYNISDLSKDMPYIQLKGKIFNIQTKGLKRSKRLTASFKDSTGIIDLVWFKGISWVKNSIKQDKEYIIFGKPSNFNGVFNIVHPEMDLYVNSKENPSALQPVYHSTELLKRKGLNSRAIGKLVLNLLTLLDGNLSETLSQKLINKLNFASRIESYKNIHNPHSNNELQKSQKRLKFEEFFFFQIHLLNLKLTRKKKFKGYKLNNLSDGFNDFYNKYLPFDLTGAQKRVLREIRIDVKQNVQMNRLLQGDVGSGKTLVALLSMLMAVDNGFQACLMAPTEILSRQHYQTITNYLKNQDINVDILTGSTKSKYRKKLHKDLLSGKINILIGTHALIEDKVKFANLAFVVIDEQHRFGVAQRARLWKKNHNPPHILVMTATPIPRTLSMTLYGDLDVSKIDELPPGRKDVKTIWKTDSSRLKIISFMREQISIGRQIYIVFPLIEESEKLDYKNLVEGYNSIEREFPLPKYQVSIVHGKMNPEDKEYEMKRFVDGTTNILIATTVIEVGVNVPNATVMIIESAERFGLSQLHQLRGRVGRGSDQSYCILMSGDKLSSDARIRLKNMVETNDGFRISEVDLRLRGPGDMMGTKQSGLLDFKIADLATDNKILEYARNEALNLLKEDSKLVNSENINILNTYKVYSKKRMGWNFIS